MARLRAMSDAEIARLTDTATCATTSPPRTLDLAAPRSSPFMVRFTSTLAVWRAGISAARAMVP